MRHLRRVMIRVVALGIACAVLPQAGFSQIEEPQAPPEILGVQEVPVTFADPLATIDSMLRRGEWLQARAAALDLIEQTRTRLVGSELAGPVSRLALAEAGWGHEEAAAWHWHVAQNLDRSILSAQDLASFGKAGEVLARHPLRKAGTAPAGWTVFESEDSQVRAGRRVQGEIPKMSQDVAALPVPKALRVQVVVDPEGRLSEPVVLAGGVPGLVWEVLEGLREWRYEPARKGEDTVAVFRTVSINNPDKKPLTGIAPLPEKRAEAESLLRAGRWRNASQLAEKLWNESLNSPGNTLRDLAAVMTLRALADAGLGRENQAVCRWQAAQHLDPNLYNADLSTYGTAGALLEKNRWGEEPPQRFDGYVAPQARHKVEIPKASRFLKLEGTLEIAAIRGRDGSLRQPLFLKAGSPDRTFLEGFRATSLASRSEVFASRLVALNALDCLCGWSFGIPYLDSSQIVFGIPFSITPLGFTPANHSGWGPTGVPGAGSPRHFPQPTNPNGPRTPVPGPPG
jgi:DNA-binding transcriptional ArsR family regulator